MIHDGMMAVFFWFSMGLSVLFTVLFGAVLVLAIIWLWRRIRAEDAGRSEEALRVLEQRYARGEVTSEEFRRMKRELRGAEQV